MLDLLLPAKLLKVMVVFDLLMIGPCASAVLEALERELAPVVRHFVHSDMKLDTSPGAGRSEASNRSC